MTADQDKPEAPPPGLPNAVFWPLEVLATVGAVLAYWYGGEWLRAHHAPLWTGIASTVGYCIAILCLSVIPALRGMRRQRLKMTAPCKRYLIRFMASMTLYCFLLTASIFSYIYLKPTGVAAWGWAILPALPLIAAIVVMGVYLREETDEVMRAMAVESSLWATGGVFAIATVWGFLEIFKLVPHVPAFAVFPLWAACLGPAHLLVRKRYQ